MAVPEKKVETPLDLILRGYEALPGWMARMRDEDLGPVVIRMRQISDRNEAASAEALRRFEKSGAWAADGALDLVAWLKSNGKLSGGAAMERVAMGRQLEKLPETARAFQRGDLGYQHVAILSRTAEKVGTGAFRKEEASLIEAAQSMDPGQFAGVAKAFEFRVDHAAALADANRAYSRRYLHLSEPKDGLVHLEGLLDAEGGAIVKTALDALMPAPHRDDDRTAGQRRADALVDLARRPLSGSKLGSSGGMRPHLVITASVETLAGVQGAPAAELQAVGPIANETAQRLACDATVSWLLGGAEMEQETSHEHRQIPPSIRRALVARDKDCVFSGCHRPPDWCDGHHIKWWTRGGETKLENLVLVCGRHHWMVHEGGWTIERIGGRWVTKPPGHRVETQARSA
ncbi:MAG TPA: DUF222 domain-containing protein [Candidatus Dormibacteraeota bacterium]